MLGKSKKNPPPKEACPFPDKCEGDYEQVKEDGLYLYFCPVCEETFL